MIVNLNQMIWTDRNKKITLPVVELCCCDKHRQRSDIPSEVIWKWRHRTKVRSLALAGPPQSRKNIVWPRRRHFKIFPSRQYSRGTFHLKCPRVVVLAFWLHGTWRYWYAKPCEKHRCSSKVSCSAYWDFLQQDECWNVTRSLQCSIILADYVVYDSSECARCYGLVIVGFIDKVLQNKPYGMVFVS